MTYVRKFTAILVLMSCFSTHLYAGEVETGLFKFSIVDKASGLPVPARVLIRDRSDKDHFPAGENGVFLELFDMAEYCCIPQVKARSNRKHKVCLSEGAILHLLDGLSVMFRPAGG